MRAHPATQLGAVLRTVAAMRRVPTGAAGLLALYLVLGGAISAATAWGLTVGRPRLEAVVLGYVFPDDWMPAIGPLFRGLLADQSALVFVNAVLMTSTALLSALLFPLKEALSRAFEEGQAWAPAAPERPLRLWQQGWDEGRLLLFYLALQLTIFWIGLGESPIRGALAGALGTGFLWVQMALDFGSPGLQRRGLWYSELGPLMLRRPLAALGYGALYTAPVQVLGALLQPTYTRSPGTALGWLLAANTLATAAAVLGGTRLAAELLDLPVRALHGARRAAGHVACWGLVALNLAAAFLLGRTLHRASQVLKCNYHLVPGTWKLEAGVLDALVAGRLEPRIHGDVEIHNPTPFDLALARLTLDIRHGGQLVAQPVLDALSVRAGERRRQTVRFVLPVDLSTLSWDLLDTRWSLTLRVPALPGLEVPLVLLRE